MAPGRAHDGIEFLVPDERAFGEATPAEFVGMDLAGGSPFVDDGAPRWTGLAAVAIVAAVVGTAVMVAQPWRDSTVPASTVTASTAPASTVPASTEPAGSTAIGSADEPVAGDAAPLAPTYVLDPVPDGLFLANRGDASTRTGTNGWGEVWAEDGATRSAGRWVALTLLPFRSPENWRGPVSDVDLGGVRGQLRTLPDGVSSVQFDRGQPDAERLVVVSGFGVDVVAVARSIGIVDDRPALSDDRPVVLDPSVLDGLRLIAASPTTLPLPDDVLFPRRLTSWSLYRGIDVRGGGRDTVLVQSSPVESDDPRLAELASVRIKPVAGTLTVPDTFTGEGLELSTRHLDGGDLVLQVARWVVDDTRLTVLTDLPFDDLLALLPAVRLGT